MRFQPALVGLTLVNMALLVVTLAALHPAGAATEPMPVLRGRALEIVDARGQVRASIAVLPGSTSKDGEAQAETVLLRLITERGRPSVKIAASEESAGMSLVGPTGTKDTYVQVIAGGTTSLLKLRNEDGRQQLLTP